MESVPTPVSDEAPMWEGNEDEMARLCGLHTTDNAHLLVEKRLISQHSLK